MNDDLINRLVEATETIAQSLKKMVDEPFVEIEPPPPKCPHCNTLFPVITIEEGGGTGNIATFVAQGSCHECGKYLYAISNEWIIYPNRDFIETHIHNLEEKINGSRNLTNS